MSERIDHAAEAREWIDAAARHPGAVSTAILAQAEATLALVEQQRIANEQIAEVIHHVLNELPPFRHLVMRAANAYDVEPTTDIATALGIGDDDE